MNWFAKHKILVFSTLLAIAFALVLFNLEKDKDIGLSGNRSTFVAGTINSDGALLVSETYVDGAVDEANDVYAIVQKPLAISTYTGSRFQNLGANTTLNVKAAAGNVFSIKVHNINAAARYFQLHNTSTTPSAAAVPFLTFLIPAQSERTVGTEFFTEQGVHFDSGIAFAFSSTEATYTAASSTDQMTAIIYK